MAAMAAMVAMKPMAIPCQGQEELEVEQQELREGPRGHMNDMNIWNFCLVVSCCRFFDFLSGCSLCMSV